MATLTTEDLRRRASAAQDLPPPAARKAIRVGAGVTVPEMASVVGVTRQAVELWEAGLRTPRGDHLERYVAALRACRGEP